MKAKVILTSLTLVLTMTTQSSLFSQSSPAQSGKPAFEFPALPYSYDALEPFIDKMTMEIHYTRHHRAYYDNFVKAITGTEWESKSLNDIFAGISKASAVIRNNGGGYYNHILFWENMAPQGQGGQMSAELKKAIESAFGSVENFIRQFNDAAKGRFGSGWAWLVKDAQGNLFISSTPNQDNPLMDVAEKKGTPILGLDVWEHAYYLKYQNRRPDYIEAFWNIVNWNAVNERFAQ